MIHVVNLDQTHARAAILAPEDRCISAWRNVVRMADSRESLGANPLLNMAASFELAGQLSFVANL